MAEKMRIRTALKKNWFTILLVAIVILTPFFVWQSGFCNIVSIVEDGNDADIAKLITSMTFPMTGVLVFVSNQSLTYLKQYKDGKSRLYNRETAYTCMCCISVATIVACAMASLLSFQYFKSGGDLWLSSALCALLTILTWLILNAVSFCISVLKWGAK